jgi:hypothetical protein
VASRATKRQNARGKKSEWEAAIQKLREVSQREPQYFEDSRIDALFEIGFGIENEDVASKVVRQLRQELRDEGLTIYVSTGSFSYVGLVKETETGKLLNHLWPFVNYSPEYGKKCIAKFLHLEKRFPYDLLAVNPGYSITVDFRPAVKDFKALALTILNFEKDVPDDLNEEEYKEVGLRKPSGKAYFKSLVSGLQEFRSYEFNW